MKSIIRSVSVEYKFADFGNWGTCWIIRKDDTLHNYRIETLTQYQRAVRLLNAFVERNMK